MRKPLNSGAPFSGTLTGAHSNKLGQSVTRFAPPGTSLTIGAGVVQVNVCVLDAGSKRIVVTRLLVARHARRPYLIGDHRWVNHVGGSSPLSPRGGRDAWRGKGCCGSVAASGDSAVGCRASDGGGDAMTGP